jgi:hypothetical protein
MATKPTVPNVVVGQKVSAAAWNAGVTDAWQFEDAQRPVCMLVQNTVQATYAASTLTDTVWDGEILDRDSQHDLVTNPARVTIGNTLGWYECSGLITWSNANGGSTRRCCLAKNGVQVNGAQSIVNLNGATSAFSTAVLPPFLVQATASTDYVTLQGWHEGSVAMSPVISGSYRSHFRVVYLGS